MEISVNKQSSIVTWNDGEKVIKKYMPFLKNVDKRDDNTVCITSIKENRLSQNIFDSNGDELLEIKLVRAEGGLYDGVFSWEYNGIKFERKTHYGQVNYYKNYDVILWLDRRKSESNCIKGITRNNEIKFACSGPNNAQPLNLNYSSTVKPKISFWPVDKNKDSGWYYFNPDTLEYEFICITR